MLGCPVVVDVGFVVRCLESSDFQPSAAKKFIDQRFVLDVSLTVRLELPD